MAKITPNILRWSRIITAIIVTALLTAVLTSHGMAAPRFAGFLAKIQFLPAAMAFSVVTVIVILIATLAFGRIYCSVLCPLGAFQDFFARVSRLGPNHRRRWYHYCEPATKLRNLTLSIVVLSILLGISLIVSFLDPYSIYSRGCAYLLQPEWIWLSNFFLSKPVTMAAASVTGIVSSLIVLGAIAWAASLRGRLFCNTLCPVGTTLGYVSKYSIFRIDIDTDKCIQCRECEHVCKAQCIDLVSHVVDSSRCVDCFDCLPVCPNDAIHYTWTRHQLSIPMMMRSRGSLAGSAAGMGAGHLDTNSPSDVPGARLVLDRRAFLATGLVIAVSPVVAKAKRAARMVGGLSEGQVSSKPSVPVTPPGVSDRQEFLERCTGCGLCISHCMTGVLRPSTTEYGLLRVLHPVKNYDIARCGVGCTRCTHLCPTGALRPLTKEEKRHSPVGLARVTLSECMSYSDGIRCGKCAEACRVEAIVMADRGVVVRGPAPVVDPGLCIGCGSCQFVCPSKPYKAIIVNGLS